MTLKTLEVSDFITSYIKYDYPKREVYYRLTDFYSNEYAGRIQKVITMYDLFRI